MAAPSKVNFKIYQGSTFSEVLRWESSTKVYKPITGITQAAPMVITSTAHGVPIGWRFKVTNVTGMKEINSTENYHVATEVSADSITVNAVNSLGYTAYTSGGVVEYNKPIDLTGYTARMQIREKIDSDIVIHELTTENGGIILNNTDKTITLYISATNTALFNFTSVVYGLELASSLAVVESLATGSISLIKEVTR